MTVNHMSRTKGVMEPVEERQGSSRKQPKQASRDEKAMHYIQNTVGVINQRLDIA